MNPKDPIKAHERLYEAGVHNTIEQEKLSLERAKLQIDIVKHLMTIAAGALVLMPALVSSRTDLRPVPGFAVWLLCASLVLFAISLVIHWVNSFSPQRVRLETIRLLCVFFGFACMAYGITVLSLLFVARGATATESRKKLVGYSRAGTNYKSKCS